MNDTSGRASEARREMVARMFGAIDAGDVDGFLEYMAPEAIQRFGNQEPLRGRVEMRAANTAFVESLASLRHEVLSVWESEEGVVCRLRVTYGRHDGTRVTLPGVTIFREQDGLISEYLVLFDIAPVFTAQTGGDRHLTQALRRVVTSCPDEQNSIEFGAEEPAVDTVGAGQFPSDEGDGAYG